MGRQHQVMDRPAVRKVPEGSGEQDKVEKTGCKIVCGAPTTFAVKGLMMMMMMSPEGVSRCSPFLCSTRYTTLQMVYTYLLIGLNVHSNLLRMIRDGRK